VDQLTSGFRELVVLQKREFQKKSARGDPAQKKRKVALGTGITCPQATLTPRGKDEKKESTTDSKRDVPLAAN